MTHPCFQSAMKKVLRKGLPIWLMLLGLGVLLYPTVIRRINRIHSSTAVQELSQQLQNADQAELARQLALAEDYNRALREQRELSVEYDAILNFGDGILGVLRIPSIGAELPIYHGLDSDVLAKGVGHMPGSAFPIGGSGNHSVLSGHTGLPSAKLLTDLSKLCVGDVFFVLVAGREVSYRVDQIFVVLPTESDPLMAVPGMDFCTLVTCTPYGINSHRLLVRGSRIEEGEP